MKKLEEFKELNKLKTGIKGFDSILQGGLPEGRASIITGGPGCGKTVLALQFCYYNAMAGVPGIFVAFEESASSIRENALTLGWDLPSLEKEGRLFLMEGFIDPKIVLSGDFNLDGLLAIIDGKAKAMGAKYIVFDALDVLLRIFNDPRRERSEIYALHNWLKEEGMTSIMTVKMLSGESRAAYYEFLDFLVDCVIFLDQRVCNQISTSRLRIKKYRGSDFSRNEYPYVIKRGGIKFVPVSSTSLSHKPLGERVSSGHEKLDFILGGGYRRHASILIAGLSGAGKTTLAATFAENVCGRKERLLYLSFEESGESIMENMLSPGIDLRPFIESGNLKFLTIMPESTGTEEHLLGIFSFIEDFQPKHVVMDSVSSCKRMGSEKNSFDFIIRFFDFCKQKGITIIITNQLDNQNDITELSGMDISSVIDTIVFLKMEEIGGEINRLLMVLKSRGSKHSNQYREFLITDNGIDIKDIYTGEGGTLAGTARLEQEAREEFENRKRRNIILKKKQEVIHRERALKAEADAMNSELEMLKKELEYLEEEENIRLEERSVRKNMRKAANWEGDC